MKKSHENWNDYLTESTDYPEELYQATDRLELRIRKEKRKKRLLFSSIPTTAAALLFVILMNTSVVFARTMADIPILSKISELVMYNESLKSAVENRNIQYVNLKAENGDLELKLPYVIADSKNLVLFLEMPENLELSGDEVYVVNIDYLRDLSNDNFISDGFFSNSGSYITGQNPLMQVNIEFVEEDLHRYSIQEGLPQNFELSLSLQKYKRGTDPEEGLLSVDAFKFELSLDPFKEPVIYPLNEEVVIEGQKILFKEMVSYPVRSEIIFEYPEANDSDINLRLSLLEDGGMTSLSGYAQIQRHHDGAARQTIHIRSDYFNPPKSKSISIDSYTIKPKNENSLYQIDLEKKTMSPEIDGIKLADISHEDGLLVFTFNATEQYPYSLISFFLGDGQFIDIVKEARRSDYTYLYYIEDKEYETLEIIQSIGPEYILEEPILIPIPVGN